MPCLLTALSGSRLASDFNQVSDEAHPKLYINHLVEYDWLIALEFGRVDDAQPPDNWRGVSDEFGYLHDAPTAGRSASR